MTMTGISGLLRKTRLFVLIVALLGWAIPATVQAGKEGIYVSDSVYFTLEKVRLSAATDDSILRFAVKLHNGWTSSIDYNAYGVRVTDDEGFSYSAQLTGAQSARVLPGQEREFAYESRVSKGARADQLRVTVFAWSYGTGAAMNDLGSFSVAYAMSEAADGVQEAIVPLAPVDSSQSSDSSIAWSIGSEYTVYEDGEWNVYVDLLAHNKSNAGLVLPTGLKMRLENADGQQTAATAIDGADKSLLPGKPQRITVKAKMADSASADGWSLQFYYMNGDNAVVLDSLDLGIGAASGVMSIGDSRSVTDSQGQEIVSLQAVSAAVLQNEDGQWVRTKVAVGNNGSRVVAIPGLSAIYQSVNGGVTVAAADTGTHPAYLSPGETETFTFTALLPKGLTADELQLALFEMRNASGSNATTGNGTNGANGANGANNNSTAGASASSVLKVPVLLAELSKAEINNERSAADYTIGGRVEMPLDKKLDVAVTELKLYDNENYGYKTAVAKLKWTNLDNTAYALPDIALDIVDENGHVYTGTRQTNTISQLATNSSYMVTYSFIMPEAVEGQAVALRLYDGKVPVPLQTVKIGIEQELASDDVWDVYPYRITVNNSSLMVNGTLSSTFSYSLQMNLGLERTEQMITDAAVSKLQFELADSSGLVMSAQTLPFQGTTKLLDGDNTISFSNLKLNQFNSTNYVNVYEVVDTPNGVVKRKLGEIR